MGSLDSTNTGFEYPDVTFFLISSVFVINNFYTFLVWTEDKYII
jgi:hypothetical protein